MKKQGRYPFQFVIDECQNNLQILAGKVDVLRTEIQKCTKQEKEEWLNIDQVLADRQKSARDLVEQKNTFQSEDMTMYCWNSDGFHRRKRSMLNTVQRLQAKRNKMEKHLYKHQKSMKCLFKKLCQYEAHKQKTEQTSRERIKRLELKNEEDLLILYPTRE